MGMKKLPLIHKKGPGLYGETKYEARTIHFIVFHFRGKTCSKMYLKINVIQA